MKHFLDNLQESLWSFCVTISTFFLGLVHVTFSNLPIIHDIVGTIGLLLGCISCVVIIIVNIRQAKINELVLKEKEKKASE